MRISGDLVSGGARTVLRLLGKNGSNGVLRLRSRERGARIRLSDGRILQASLDSSPPLGDVLASEGVVDPGQLEGALSIQRRGRRGRPLGQILVELGLVERGDLGLALERQIKNIVRELLVWTEGSYAFEPTAEPDPDPTFGGVELDALLEDLQRA